MKYLYLAILILILSNAFFVYDYINRPAPKTETIIKRDTLLIRDTVNHLITSEIKTIDTIIKAGPGALLKLDTITPESLKLSIGAFCPDTGNAGFISLAYILPPALVIRDSITTLKTVLIPGAEAAFYKRFGFGYICGLATAAGASYLAIRAFK